MSSGSKLLSVSKYKSPWIPNALYNIRPTQLLVSDKEQLKIQKQLSKNPFEAEDEMDNLARLKLLVGLVLVPIRVFLLTVLMIVGSLLNIILTLPFDKSKPLPDIVMRIQEYISFVIVPLGCFVVGLVVDVKGAPASIDECKMQVYGPHTSFLDSFIVNFVNNGHAISPVGKKEVAANALLRMNFEATQTILVDRSSKEERSATSRKIRERVMNDEWKRRVIIFPEGTTHNRTSLIQFKTGAFAPGAPVQPIVIRWDQELAWASGSASRTWLTLRSLAELYHVCEVEFMPVYHPTEEEIEDPILYANNVRDVMAETLDIGVTEFGFSDRGLAKYVAKRGIQPGAILNFPIYDLLMEVAEVRDSSANLSELKREITQDVKIMLKYFLEHCDEKSWKMNERGFKVLTKTRFLQKMGLDEDDLTWSSFSMMEEIKSLSFQKFAFAVVRRKY